MTPEEATKKRIKIFEDKKEKLLFSHIEDIDKQLVLKGRAAQSFSYNVSSDFEKDNLIIALQNHYESQGWKVTREQGDYSDYIYVFDIEKHKEMILHKSLRIAFFATIILMTITLLILLS